MEEMPNLIDLLASEQKLIQNEKKPDRDGNAS